jgi:hypothetical protein
MGRLAEMEGMAHDEGVVAGFDPGVLLAIRNDNPAKTEIETSSHERRADGQAADLNHEAGIIPRVVIAHNAADVAKDLAYDAEREGDAKGRGPAGRGPDDDETDEGQGEDDGEGDVGGQVDVVVVVAGDVVVPALVDGRVLGAPLGAVAAVDPGLVAEV